MGTSSMELNLSLFCHFNHSGRDKLRQRLLKSLADILLDITAKVFCKTNGPSSCLSSEDSLSEEMGLGAIS